ncbi:hypothetical protein BDU57DRAFT_509126 [Ampelomyces quisqualis]|uniref:RING-CH-type domain-containing protein n=1 Tax=Ampelomyces quisqualis TaxID=50730 RepID=A0A6A5R0S1_AMPQU|nr:hypothetical protein BDU57DRAFT_509126 [Ampelomyces quisqualis]
MTGTCPCVARPYVLSPANMASLPPQRPVSQRRAAPPAELPVSQQEQATRTNSFSAQSVDSPTLLLPSPPQPTARPVKEEQADRPQATEPVQEQDDEPRKCWICFNDETEDDETTSAWRSPCTCSLVAHETCLLDWIADMEAPNPRRRAGTRAATIQCPQCKVEIRVARPRSYVVDAVRLCERLTGSLLLPGCAVVTGTALWSTLTVAGTNTIYQLFGPRDALAILAPLYETPDMRITVPAMRIFAHLQKHWRLDLGLPLIPAVLVASRTTFADSFLPFLPLIFFVSSGQPGDEMMQLQWPPSAAFSFAVLPYLRGFYNAFYDRVCLPREQKWLKEIQPRAGTEDDDDDAQELDDHDPDHDVVHEVEIDVDLNMFGDWNNHQPHIAPEPARPLDAPPPDEEEMPALVEVDAAPGPNIARQPVQPRRQVRRGRNIAFSTTSLADTILGALIFPSIAAAMGEILKYSLPPSWVTPPSNALVMSWLGGWISTGGKAGNNGRLTGFLQTRWGRSLVGGCLFVGLKDAVLLYVRWKMSQNHRKRKVLDHDSKKRKVGVAGS